MFVLNAVCVLNSEHVCVFVLNSVCVCDVLFGCGRTEALLCLFGVIVW